MLTLSLIAASLVAVAALLPMTTRSMPAARTAWGGDRGITLQTLIVTAVLVLMAVAAGVVIVAITRNAQENLEGSADFQTDARCNPVEIYNAQLAAAGAFGANIEGQVQGSGIGCVPACVLQFPAYMGVANPALSAHILDPANYKLSLREGIAEADVVVLTTNHFTNIEMDRNDLISPYRSEQDGPTETDALISSQVLLFQDPTTVVLYEDKDSGMHARVGVELVTDDLADWLTTWQVTGVESVRVAPNGNQCQAYDVTGKVVTVFGS